MGKIRLQIARLSKFSRIYGMCQYIATDVRKDILKKIEILGNGFWEILIGTKQWCKLHVAQSCNGWNIMGRKGLRAGYNPAENPGSYRA